MRTGCSQVTIDNSNERPTVYLANAISGCQVDDENIGGWPQCTTACTQTFFEAPNVKACSFIAPLPPGLCASPSSPLGDTFNGSKVVEVDSSGALDSALNALSGPTIITIKNAGTYVLDKVYYVQSNLCIQVSGMGNNTSLCRM